jgi:hypothetical protein
MSQAINIPGLFLAASTSRDIMAAKIFLIRDLPVSTRNGFAVVNVMKSDELNNAVTILRLEMTQPHNPPLGNTERIFRDDRIALSPATWKIGTFDPTTTLVNQLVSPLIVRTFFASCWNSAILNVARYNSKGIAVNAVPSGVFLFNEELPKDEARIPFHATALWTDLKEINSQFNNFKIAVAIGVMCTNNAKVKVSIYKADVQQDVSLGHGDVIYVDLSVGGLQGLPKEIFVSAKRDGGTEDWYAFVVVHYVWLVGGRESTTITNALVHGKTGIAVNLENIVTGLRNYQTASLNCIEELPNDTITRKNLYDTTRSGNARDDLIYNRAYFEIDTPNWYLKPFAQHNNMLDPYIFQFDTRQYTRDFAGEFAERVSICYYLKQKDVVDLHLKNFKIGSRHEVNSSVFEQSTSRASSLFMGVSSISAPVMSNVPITPPRLQQLSHVPQVTPSRLHQPPLVPQVTPTRSNLPQVTPPQSSGSAGWVASVAEMVKSLGFGSTSASKIAENLTQNEGNETVITTANNNLHRNDDYTPSGSEKKSHKRHHVHSTSKTAQRQKLENDEIELQKKSNELASREARVKSQEEELAKREQALAVKEQSLRDQSRDIERQKSANLADIQKAQSLFDRAAIMKSEAEETLRRIVTAQAAIAPPPAQPIPPPQVLPTIVINQPPAPQIIPQPQLVVPSPAPPPVIRAQSPPVQLPAVGQPTAAPSEEQIAKFLSDFCQDLDVADEDEFINTVLEMLGRLNNTETVTFFKTHVGLLYESYKAQPKQ